MRSKRKVLAVRFEENTTATTTPLNIDLAEQDNINRLPSIDHCLAPPLFRMSICGVVLMRCPSEVDHLEATHCPCFSTHDLGKPDESDQYGRT